MTYPLAGFVQGPVGSSTPLTMNLLDGGGECTLDRHQQSAMGSAAIGRVRLCIFEAQRTETISHLKIAMGTTVAVGSTDACLCAYEITKDAGVWTAHLIALGADDPTLFTVSSLAAIQSVAPFQKIAGHYYSVSYQIIGATGAPTIVGMGNLIGAASSASNALHSEGPPIMAEVATAAFPPPNSFAANAGVAGNTAIHYAEMLP